jgi:hypothetical protein
MDVHLRYEVKSRLKWLTYPPRIYKQSEQKPMGW